MDCIHREWAFSNRWPLVVFYSVFDSVCPHVHPFTHMSMHRRQCQPRKGAAVFRGAEGMGVGRGAEEMRDVKEDAVSQEINV